MTFDAYLRDALPQAEFTPLGKAALTSWSRAAVPDSIRLRRCSAIRGAKVPAIDLSLTSLGLCSAADARFGRSQYPVMRRPTS